MAEKFVPRPTVTKLAEDYRALLKRGESELAQGFDTNVSYDLKKIKALTRKPVEIVSLGTRISYGFGIDGRTITDDSVRVTLMNVGQFADFRQEKFTFVRITDGPQRDCIRVVPGWK